MVTTLTLSFCSFLNARSTENEFEVVSLTIALITIVLPTLLVPSLQTHCLVRVGVGRSDGCHESNPSCQTITKVPCVCRVKAVFMMGIEKCVKEAENHKAILKASQEHTCDQVMLK